jgi:hypothetical protein
MHSNRKFFEQTAQDFVSTLIIQKKIDISKTQEGDRLLIFQRQDFWTWFPAEVDISATNFEPDSTSIHSNIVFLIESDFL